MYKIGIDIGGTKVNIGIIDDSFNVISKKKIPVPNCKLSKDAISYISKELKHLLMECSIDIGNVTSCGIGIPGTVSADGNVALKVPNLSWENENIAQIFKTETGIDTKLIQDSRAAAWGEYMLGGARGKNVSVCVSLGTGIGTGLVIDGKIFNGAMGSAGELGHIPVVKDGRQCGCGKKGCLENYVAGKGLGITANALFGENSTAEDIFINAKNGNKDALNAIQEAIQMLGNAMVSMINLISPDCLLFSGGMSTQKDLFIDPLIKYIEDNRYYVNGIEDLYIGIAELGEDAPMIGAALFSQKNSKREAILSASVMCVDLLNMQRDLDKIEKAGIQYLHFDVMDGHFVPNLMLPVEMINKIRSGTSLPYDIHLMVENPEIYIPKLDLKGGDIVSVHYESTNHTQRALSAIKERGAIAAVALNPATPIECVRELLDDISIVLLMTVNPGFSGQKLVPQSVDKIRRMRKYLDDLGYQNIIIEVDGNCSFENVPLMYKAGADIFVVGTSSVFNENYSIAEGTKHLCETIC